MRGLRPAWALPLLLALSGCLVDQDADRLLIVYGPQSLAFEDDEGYIVVPVLEGRIATGDGDPPWRSADAVRLAPPTIVLEKADPGPQGGGGVRHVFAGPEYSLEVRFTRANELQDLEVQWGLQSADGSLDWSPSAPAGLTHTFAMDRPGVYGAVARVVDGERVVATTAVPFVAYVSVHWTVESTVFPVKTVGPSPPNYAEMADEFVFSLEEFLPAGEFRTAFRGTWDPSKGSDVDLEFVAPDGTTLDCRTNESGGGVTGPATAAEEMLVVDLAPGDWLLRVGAVSGACAETELLLYYPNPASVPYTLEVDLNFA